jgi:hypothetical protein
MATLQGVEIFAPGHWFPSNGPKKGIKFTKEFIQRLLNNTLKKQVKPIIKLGHDEEFLKRESEGKPLFGLADNLRLKGAKILADFKNIPDWLFDAIKRKQLTKLSIEVAGTNNKNVFIDAIALLGKSKPAVKSLKALQNFFSQGTPDETIDFAVMSWNEFGNQWRARIRLPQDFRSDTFRTKDLEGVQGIQIVTGRLNPDKVPEGNDPESAVLQTYHFDKEQWPTRAEAEKWLSENTTFSEKHAISFMFSEPFMDELFFETPNFKEDNMGEEKKTQGIDPADFAKLLAKVDNLQRENDTLKNEKTELIQFKEQAEASQDDALSKERDEAVKRAEEAEKQITAFSEKEKELEELKTKNAEYEKKEKALQFSIKKGEILEPYQKDVKEGLLPPAILTKIESHLDEQKEIDGDLKISLAFAQEIGKAYAGKMPKGEQGDDLNDENTRQFANFSEELAHEVVSIQAKNPGQVDYEQAQHLAFQLKPELVTKYQAWIASEYSQQTV